GKGVTVAGSRDEALRAVADAMEKRIFGDAGARITIDERLVGREVSVFAFTDGITVTPLVAASDYKRALDGDQGPNTGGMGAYGPPEFMDQALTQQIYDEILVKVVKALASEGITYKGVLYGGLMVTDEGPKVLEFNVRLGDPEAQVILPQLETDLVDVMLAVISGRVKELPIRWSEQPCVAVVMASGGYPGAYSTGYEISGLEDLDEGIAAFHAGTALASEGGQRSVMVTSGGRVLSVVARGSTLAEARDSAYRNAQRIHFQDRHYRTDIAAVPAAVEQGVRKYQEV
ncbi:MAG: phosphoribosylamine--glycine ligase, partial [Dehalococcoidia bacterium]